jgi:ribosomal protein S20
MAEKEKTKKKKMPTALKRVIQSKKIHQKARAFKSKIRTAITSIEKAVVANEGKDDIQKKLNLLNSLMDKGAKKGVCTKNKAARIKSRFVKKVIKG